MNCLENYTLKALKMNKNTETGYIFVTKIPKLVEDNGILWAPHCQVEINCWGGGGGGGD